MGIVTALSHRPELILPFLLTYADAALGLLVWYLDMLISFLAAFAAAYGLFAFAERCFPRPPGARPRVWRVPLIFAATTTAFFCGADETVSNTLRNLLDSLSLIPGQFLMRIAACVWLSGAAIRLCRTVFGARGILRVPRAAARLPLCTNAATRNILRRALEDARIARPVSLRTAPPGTPIFSCGIGRANIVVPEDFAARRTPEEQRAILLHECVHVRRRDSITLPCMAIAGAAIWFDPVVRRALRRMKSDMEMFCDWAAVRLHGVPPALYAALIVDAAAGNGAGAGEDRFAATFSEEYRAAAQRIGHILRDETILAPTRLSRRAAGFSLAALSAALLAAAAYHATLTPVPPTPPESVRDAAGEVLNYEERRGVFAVYGFVCTKREQ